MFLEFNGKLLAVHTIWFVAKDLDRWPDDDTPPGIAVHGFINGQDYLWSEQFDTESQAIKRYEEIRNILARV